MAIERSEASVEADRAEAQRGMDGKTTPLYVVCSPCRGVGKTLISRLLTEFHVLADRRVAAFDLADEGPQLADYLPQLTTIANINDIFGQMAFFERLIGDDAGAKIIDLSHRAFDNFFSVVQEIALARQWRVPHYYMGYWVDGCSKMDYKANFRPHEILVEGEWRRVE